MRSDRSRRLLGVIGLGLAVGVGGVLPVLATEAAPAPGADGAAWRAPVSFDGPLQGRAALRSLRTEGAVADTASANGLSPERLSEILREDDTAWLDSTGRMFYRDRARFDSPAEGRRASAGARLAALPYAPGEVFGLHSLPGSQRTIYLDFDGGTVTGTAWNETAERSTLVATPFDIDGDPTTFNKSERDLIQEAWLRVAEDYAPFDVDVTTEAPSRAQLERSSERDQVFGLAVMITSARSIEDDVCGGPGATGIAYLGAFTDIGMYYQPAWACTHTHADLINVSETISHEAGHTFGLGHDGSATEEYYAGQGGWMPVMGSGYEPIAQWSNGWYSGADNPEDDVALIARNGAPYRADEAGGTVATAAALTGETAYISRRDDVDVWALGSCSGSVTLDAQPAPFSPNLDIELRLLDSSGAKIASADPTSTRVSTTVASGMDASLTRSLASGDYYAAVDGVGRGTRANGYDDYGSLGAYTLRATGCDGSTDPSPTTDPTPTVEPTTDPTPAGPPAAPGPVTVERGKVGGKKTITVWWTAPESVDPVDRYRIRTYKIVRGKVKARSKAVVRGTWEGAELPVGKGKWQVAVQARNSAGWGPLTPRSKTVKAR